MSDETEVKEPETVNARWLLDQAIDAAVEESADGRFQVHVPVFGRMIVMRKLNFDEMTQCRQLDPKAGNRAMIRLSIVDPPFSAGEVDELMTDGRLLHAAILINNAVNKINHLTEAEQAVVAATFRPVNQRT